MVLTVIKIIVGSSVFVIIAVIGLALGLVFGKKPINKSCGSGLCKHESGQPLCRCEGHDGEMMMIDDDSPY